MFTPYLCRITGAFACNDGVFPSTTGHPFSSLHGRASTLFLQDWLHWQRDKTSIRSFIICYDFRVMPGPTNAAFLSISTSWWFSSIDAPFYLRKDRISVLTAPPLWYRCSLTLHNSDRWKQTNSSNLPLVNISSFIGCACHLLWFHSSFQWKSVITQLGSINAMKTPQKDISCRHLLYRKDRYSSEFRFRYCGTVSHDR